MWKLSKRKIIVCFCLYVQYGQYKYRNWGINTQKKNLKSGNQYYPQVSKYLVYAESTQTTTSNLQQTSVFYKTITSTVSFRKLIQFHLTSADPHPI